MSVFVWLDYSERERRKMLDGRRCFQRTRHARRGLGVGSVRDAFADTLFPGTSTINDPKRGTFCSYPGRIRGWKDCASDQQR